MSTDVPGTLTELEQLIQLVSDQEVEKSIEDLVEIISRIPDISNAVINHVNSPEIAMRHVVSTLGHAVAILGPNRTVEFLGKRLRTDSPQNTPRVRERKIANSETISSNEF